MTSETVTAPGGLSLDERIRTALPALLELADMALGAYALLREFEATIFNSLEDDHPAAGEVREWLTRYESLTHSGEQS